MVRKNKKNPDLHFSLNWDQRSIFKLRECVKCIKLPLEWSFLEKKKVSGTEFMKKSQKPHFLNHPIDSLCV